MFYNHFQWQLHDYVINVATIMLRRHKKDLIICSKKVTVVLNFRHSHNFNFLFDRFNLLNLDKKINKKNIENLCIELTICISLCVCLFVCVLVSVSVSVCVCVCVLVQLDTVKCFDTICIVKSAI